MVAINKKALIITAYYSYDLDVRLNVLEEVLLSLGYQTTIISSNFDHRKKTFIVPPKDNVIFLPSIGYKKNISIKRIKSHVLFSHDILKYCESNFYDLIYAITPPNSFFADLSLYKKSHPLVKVVCEIEDLWPESLPVSSCIKFLLSPIFHYWSSKRNKSLKMFDVIIFECYLHKNYICKINSSLTCRIARLSKSVRYFKESANDVTDAIVFLYLGSVNNLIDYKLIVFFLKNVSYHRKVFLNIVGGGERIREFESLLQKENIPFHNYGVVFDNNAKKNIFSRCHFGLNIMKKNVFVGVTMKSLDYFSFGLPIINNIKGDTFDIVSDYQCGMNLDSDTVPSVAKAIGTLSEIEYKEMAAKSQFIYESLFSKDAVADQLKTILKEIEGN